jgi:uncharacterized membrane protein required for colicin V production
MILDIILIAVVTALIILGFRRGIARTLFNLLSLFLSAVCGYFVANFASNWIYSSFIAPDVKSSVAQSISSTTGETTSVIENLPDAVRGILNLFGVTDESVSTAVSNTAKTTSNVVSDVVESTIASAVTSVLTIVLLVVCFLLLLIIFKFISKRLLKIFKIPVLKQLNRFFGGVLGLCEGLILCFVGVAICAIIVPLNGNFFVTPELISQSTIFNLIYSSDLISTLSSSVVTGQSVVTEISTALQ